MRKTELVNGAVNSVLLELGHSLLGIVVDEGVLVGEGVVTDIELDEEVPDAILVVLLNEPKL